MSRAFAGEAATSATLLAPWIVQHIETDDWGYIILPSLFEIHAPLRVWYECDTLLVKAGMRVFWKLDDNSLATFSLLTQTSVGPVSQ